MVLVRHSDLEDTKKFVEIMLLQKAALTDRTSDEEVQQINKLTTQYKQIAFNTVVNKLKDKDGKNIDLQKAMDNKKELLKPIKVKALAPIKDEFAMTDIKNLIKD